MKLALTAVITYLVAVGTLVTVLAWITSGSNLIGVAWGAGAAVVGSGVLAFCYWRHKKAMEEKDTYW